MRTYPRDDPMQRPPRELEHLADAEAQEQPRNDEAYDRQIEDGTRSPETLAEGEPGKEADDRGQRQGDDGHDHRAAKGAAQIAIARAGEEIAEPMRRGIAQRKGHAALRALEGQDEDRQHGSIEEQDEQR